MPLHQLFSWGQAPKPHMTEANYCLAAYSTDGTKVTSVNHRLALMMAKAGGDNAFKLMIKSIHLIDSLKYIVSISLA
jgi:hypothetical protein